MATCSSGHFRRLMSEYTFDKDTSDDLKCMICGKLMIDAYQTYCGCHYCRECLDKHLKDGYFYCRGGKDECKEEHLVLDKNANRNAMMNRKISRHKVRCPNESCTFTSELDKMEGHLRLCTEKSIMCPFSKIGCDNGGLSKDKTLTHLHNETLVHSNLLMEVIDNLKNEVRGLREVIQTTKDDNETKVRGLVDEIRALRRETATVKALKKEVEGLDKDVRKFQSDTKVEMETIKTEINKKSNIEAVNKLLADLRDKVISDERTIYTMGERMKMLPDVGVYSYTILKFSEKNAKDEILTPHFYSHTRGYKLRLKIHPVTRVAGGAPHLSVLFVICKGEFDDLLPWPCMHTVNVSVINQRTEAVYKNVSYSHSTAADNDRPLFNKPTKDDNKGYGREAFISHTDLLANEGLVVEDSVVIRCAVFQHRGSI